jgi:hypothetical protein
MAWNSHPACLAFAILQWFACRKAATRQVRRFVEDVNRKQAILAYFRSVGALGPTVSDRRDRAGVREAGETRTNECRDFCRDMKNNWLELGASCRTFAKGV